MCPISRRHLSLISEESACNRAKSGSDASNNSIKWTYLMRNGHQGDFLSTWHISDVKTLRAKLAKGGWSPYPHAVQNVFNAPGLFVPKSFRKDDVRHVDHFPDPVQFSPISPTRSPSSST